MSRRISLPVPSLSCLACLKRNIRYAISPECSLFLKSKSNVHINSPHPHWLALRAVSISSAERRPLPSTE
jgi:hypothetical protein